MSRYMSFMFFIFLISWFEVFGSAFVIVLRILFCTTASFLIFVLHVLPQTGAAYNITGFVIDLQSNSLFLMLNTLFLHSK